MTRKKNERGSCHCGHQPGKKRKRRKKGKELTSSSTGTGVVGIGKSEEPLGLPLLIIITVLFSGLYLENKTVLNKFLSITPNPWLA